MQRAGYKYYQSGGINISVINAHLLPILHQPGPDLVQLLHGGGLIPELIDWPSAFSRLERHPQRLIN